MLDLQAFGRDAEEIAQTIALLSEEEKRELDQLLASPSLWPAPYNESTPEAAYRFLTECWWTLNEADGETALIPAKPYIEWFVGEWVGAWNRRQNFLVEKSRRIIISWVCRGLETWQLGLKRQDWHLIDQTHTNSAQHLWRVHFSLKELQERRPEFCLTHRAMGSIDAKEVTHVVLPNGSLYTQGFQDAGADQGKGKSGVTLEELSKYRNPEAFWGQGGIVTMGSAKGSGGWVCGIANANPTKEWQSVKAGANARELLGLE